MFEEAMESGRNFDAVMLDLTVSGGMGGIEAAAKLKECDPDVKLIVSSGYSDAPVMSDFRKYGFDDVLPKPWVIADSERGRPQSSRTKSGSQDSLRRLLHP